MEIKGISHTEFLAIVVGVSADRYAGNVRTDWQRRHCADLTPRLLNKAGTRFSGRVIVESSRGPGARRSASGRRGAYACWHVFRDVVRATLAAHPDVTFRTSLARYTVDTFETTYPATGTVNVGSNYAPVTMPALCDCPADNRIGDPLPGQQNAYPPRVIRATPTVVTPASPDWSRERDQALAIAAGECAWCGGDASALGSAWCGQECQSLWQDKYGAPGGPRY